MIYTTPFPKMLGRGNSLGPRVFSGWNLGKTTTRPVNVDDGIVGETPSVDSGSDLCRWIDE